MLLRRISAPSSPNGDQDLGTPAPAHREVQRPAGSLTAASVDLNSHRKRQPRQTQSSPAIASSSGHEAAVALRLTDVAQALDGDDAPLQRVARLVPQLRRDDKVDGVPVGAEISNRQGQPSIITHLRLPVGA